MELLQPSNLNLNTDISGYNSGYKEKYYWIINCIIKENLVKGKTFNGYVNLNKQLLRQYMGERYTDIVIEQLKQSNIIEVNDSYYAGKFSMSYRLTEVYRQAPITSVGFTGRKAARYIYKINQYNKEQLSLLFKDETLKQIYDNILAVSIDEQGALDFIENNLSDGVFSEHQASCYKYIVSAISAKDISFSKSDNTGRIYHTIASCPKTLRQFLTYKGERLYQADNRNSQPLLFCSHMDEYLQNQSSVQGFYYSSSTISNTNLLTPYVETNTYPADVTLYNQLTSSGKFYEYIMEEWNIPSDERDEFKIDFFKNIFYSKVKTNWEHPYAKKFKQIFPVVYEAVLWHKRNDHADLPIKLQLSESNIFINGVCNRILSENPPEQRPFFIPVHDCIICLEKDTAYIQQLIEEEVYKNMGLKPTVKVKPF